MPVSTELKLLQDRVDAWQFRTDLPDLSLTSFEEVLSEDELNRANRFRFDRLRRGYILSRGTLRFLCSRYLDVDPRSLAFTYGPNGKPELDPACSLRFNLSHSGDITVFAFARDLDIGVDVEKIRTLDDIEAIVERFFCPEEAQEVLACSDADRPLVFHTCWTRKEAFIKATGDGLSTALDSFRVNLKPGAPSCLTHVNWDQEEGRRWTLQDLDLTLPYVGALCYHAPPRPLHLRSYQPVTAA